MEEKHIIIEKSTIPIYSLTRVTGQNVLTGVKNWALRQFGPETNSDRKQD